MGALFRLVSLVAVISTGFYVLYLTQGNLTAPGSLTETVSEDATPLTLGAPESFPEDPSSLNSFPVTATAELGASDWTSGGFSETEPKQPEGDMFLKSSSTESTTLVGEEPLLASAPFALEEPVTGKNPERAESRKPELLEFPATLDDQGVVKAAEFPTETQEPIQLVANDDPFALDESPEPFPATTKEAPAELNPFSEQDPFGDNISKATSAKEAPSPSNSEEDFDPFGEELKKTEPFKPVLKEDPFPDLKPLPESKKTNTLEETPAKDPIPTVSDDAFDPFPEAFEKIQPAAEDARRAEDLKRPVVGTPPAVEADPFGEPFPAKLPQVLPEKVTVEPDAFPAFSDKELNAAPALESATREESFPDEFPAFEPLETNSIANTRPEKTTDENSAETNLSRTETLPPLGEFPDLEEKLRLNSKEINLQPIPAELEPAPLPGLPESPGLLPELVGESPTELKTEPTGDVPSLTELKGDGVVAPNTPQEIQLPNLQITKVAPPKAILNTPFVYTIHVKNVGDVVANEVTVQDQIPKGSHLTGTIPQAELVGRRLVWPLGRIEPGEEQKISVRIVPVEAGPLGSVATVNFVAEVGSETIVEHPQVTFDMEIPSDAKVGDVVDCRFTIENHGERIVTGIILRDILPAGLHHPAGQDLENPLGDLQPGEKLEETLQMKVMSPGRHSNDAIITAEGGLQLKQTAVLEAVSNRLVITRQGPKERFLGRPAIFQNIVANSSEEVVEEAVMIEKLPAGMQFVQADQGGQYLAASREIHWKISSLQPGEKRTFQSRMIPTQATQGESLVRIRESQGNEIQMVSHTKIRSYASIGLEMSEVTEPVLVGDTVKLRIEATNRGNASASQVEVRAKIPPTLQLMTVRGETRFRVEGREVVFETLKALPPGETEIIELELQAAAAAPAEVAVSVKTKQMSQPMMKASAIEVHARQ